MNETKRYYVTFTEKYPELRIIFMWSTSPISNYYIDVPIEMVSDFENLNSHYRLDENDNLIKMTDEEYNKLFPPVSVPKQISVHFQELAELYRKRDDIELADKWQQISIDYAKRVEK